jgi:O-antigen ligase
LFSRRVYSSSGRRAAQILDLGLLLTIVAIAVQLVPLPVGLRTQLAPAAIAYEQATRFDATAPVARPLTIAPADTLLALIAFVAIVLVFWCARTLFARGRVRATIRALAWIGLFLSPLAIVHHAMPMPLIDAAWGLTSGEVRPFGPFVNRNDFAGWLIMTIPLTIGYVIARVQSRHRTGEPFSRNAVDSKSIWLAMAVSLMLGGLLFSTSRSGLLGAFAGLVFFAVISRRRLTARRAGFAIAGIGIALGIASAYADMGSLSARFMEGSLSEGFGGRLSIWRQTWPVIRAFWPLGSGVGTYRTVMVVYQTMSRYFNISHADNELLQILAEGGLLVGVPIALAFVGGVALIARRLREDRTAIFWPRAGAAAGLVAVAAQNMVEMTLRVPANSIVFAICAAIAMHETSAAQISPSAE